ncbi:MAG: glycoside hydrolase family 25 protein [Oscillospiraceae bacterium]|nr:glycoside hydrolase family 25 protein [Oscillospiraceae bacterium]
MIIINTVVKKILITAAVSAMIIGAVSLIAVFVIFVSAQKAALPSAESEEYIPEVPVHTYNLDKIISQGDFKYYYENGDVSSQLGIDVSYAQKEIDWKKVKESGIDFAMIRVGYRGYTEGKLNLDEYFDINAKKADEAGIGVGAYFFSQAINVEEAKEEARFVADKIKDYNITYPVAFDWEDITHTDARTDFIDGQTLTDIANTFCTDISEAGYTPIIYSSLNLLREHFDRYDRTQMLDKMFWLAEYKDKPEYEYQFSMWQYTDSGKVKGINNFVDLNILFQKK